MGETKTTNFKTQNSTELTEHLCNIQGQQLGVDSYVHATKKRSPGGNFSSVNKISPFVK